MGLFEDLSFLQWLKEECGYNDIRPLDNGRWAAIHRLAYTYAILTGPMHDRCTVTDRWCYHSYAEAQEGLNAWSGEGEPEGWHRHPYSGRRRYEGNPDAEYVDP